MNPYEPPRANLDAPADPAADAAASAPLSPELEMQAMALLGQKRVRATTISFCVWWAIMFGVLALFIGWLWAFIGGGALAGAISRSRVRTRTPDLVAEVSAELGIPPGVFRPEQYLL